MGSRHLVRRCAIKTLGLSSQFSGGPYNGASNKKGRVVLGSYIQYNNLARDTYLSR